MSGVVTGTAGVQPVREEPEVATETSGEGKPLEGSAMSSSPTRPWGEGVEGAGDDSVSLQKRDAGGEAAMGAAVSISGPTGCAVGDKVPAEGASLMKWGLAPIR